MTHLGGSKKWGGGGGVAFFDAFVLSGKTKSAQAGPPSPGPEAAEPAEPPKPDSRLKDLAKLCQRNGPRLLTSGGRTKAWKGLLRPKLVQRVSGLAKKVST